MDQDQERIRTAVEATRLGFGLTVDDIEELARTAGALGARGICVPGIFVTAAVASAREVPGWAPDVVTVVNFPTGDHDIEDILGQIRRACRDSVDHIDVVVPGALVGSQVWSGVTDFVRQVRFEAEDCSGRPIPIKVILETAALDPERIRAAAQAAIEGGARWLKTSTGFHKAGGASEEAVRLLRSVAPPEVGIKASGGIRTREDALRMLDAGADRIGTSAEGAILASG